MSDSDSDLSDVEGGGFAVRDNWRQNSDFSRSGHVPTQSGLLINKDLAEQLRTMSMGKQNAESSPSIEFKTLTEWATIHNPEKLIEVMTSNLDAIRRMLSRDDLNCDWIHFLALSFQKVLFKKNKASSRILEYVAHSNFVDSHIPKFLSKIHENPHIIPVMYKCVRSFLDILDFIALRFSDCSNKCYVCVCKIEETSRRLNILTDANDLKNRCIQLKEKSCPIPLVEGSEHTDSSLMRRRERVIPIGDEQSPPDDFKDKSIFPEMEELELSTTPFLRANKTSGAYRDLDHYTDIHFRLLREDYLSPLRDGIRAYKMQLGTEQDVNGDLRFYFNVQLVKLLINDFDGLHFLVKFDEKVLGDIKWEFSKRFLFGSLLCFTKDGFETVMFATVINRDPESLRQGLLEVVFQSNVEEILTSSEKDSFVIAETLSFFESYKHVLEGLQEVREMPLEDCILYCNPEPDPPEYVTATSSYNIGCIMAEDEEKHVRILDPSDWPQHTETVLNSAQLEAVKLALTNEVAIIQGPPGTGKTYVGLHITELLLKNRPTEAKAQTPPILVVCYTNHALDQFLEGILEFCNGGIIRVGGRSISEKLTEFNLKELRKNPRMDKRLKRSINTDLRECRKRLKKVSYLIKRHWQESVELDTNIQSVITLQDEMTSEQYASLTDPTRGGGNGKEMNVWLKASNASIENHLMKASEKRLVELILLENEEILHDSFMGNFDNVRIKFEYRVKIYRGWLQQFKTERQNSLSKLLEGNVSRNVQQIQVLMNALQDASNDILKDEDIKPYMSDKEVFDKLKLCVEQENKSHDEDLIIRTWLLGCFKKVEEILDIIGTMEKISTKKNSQSDSSGSMHDRKAYHERVVIDDDMNDEDMAGFQDFGSDDDGSDDGGVSYNSSEASRRVREFKDLVVNYKESEKRELTLLARAKMLNIQIVEDKDEDDSGGWQFANQMNYSQVFRLIRKARVLTDEEAENIVDVWSLSLPKRYSLYKYWSSNKKKEIAEEIIRLTEVYNEFLRLKKRALSKKDVAILKQGQIIGMTTTGAARYRAVLQEVKPQIIIVEEAAEVLEAHIVTTLNRHCQHLILIGDHQQLRPNPTVHTLAIDFDLEISLFERLVKNHVRHVTLQVQHRMRPEISRYLLSIYPMLRNHPNVSMYADVKGVGSNVFFLSHSFRETNVLDSKSKENIHEALFLTKLCDYFLQQEYQGKQITILAAYSGQVAVIRECMESDEERYKSVRVTSIDNYQGEENDIVMLSLVRSNLEQDVGFLKVSNRVCVALSRARQGLFVIGNMTQLESKSKLWQKILARARKNNQVGVALKLVCMNHAHQVNYVQHAGEFAIKAPEGGCDQKCGYQLFCGHICTRKCHISDSTHREFLCEEDCLKNCDKGHPCPKRCHEECGLCEILVKKKMPHCGHNDNIQCYLDPQGGICKQPCKKELPCGHLCDGFCGDCRINDSHSECMELVEKTWNLCGDKSLVHCCTDTKTTPCPAKCKERLLCGDNCKGTCGGCLTKRVHRPCEAKCKKALPCGHQCQSKCSMPCESCKTRCPTKCRHGACTKTYCGETCDVCMENCAFVCRHRQCNQRCGDECKQVPCHQLCKQITKCKHSCNSICGENCVCFNCEQGDFSIIDFTKSKPGKMVFASAERIRNFHPDKDDLFMKIPICNHVFTLRQLDDYVKAFDPDGTSYIRCPRCTNTIQGIIRYDSLNKSRLYKRENRKQQLEQLSIVSKEVIEKLKFSLEIVDSFCPFDLDHYIKHTNPNVGTSHADALRLLSRFAFVLYMIADIHKEFNSEMPFNTDKWRDSLKKYQTGITPQYKEEMAFELHRLLILEQTVTYKRLLEQAGIPISESWKNQFKALMKHDLIQKLTTKVKVEAEGFVDELHIALMSSEGEDTKENAQVLFNKASMARKILGKPSHHELYDILDSENILPAPIEEETEESSSDNSDEEDDSSQYSVECSDETDDDHQEDVK